eukprot:jgi/Bigna1/87868/estExt_fgenesh1_pg.C_250074
MPFYPCDKDIYWSFLEVFIRVEKEGPRRCIGIVRETYNAWERRSPLTPNHVRGLVKSGVRVLVEPSFHRVFTDNEYAAVGAEITHDLAEASVIFGVKQIPEERLMKDKTYLFFSHTIKGQKENMKLLDRALELGIRLIDYECITEGGMKGGRRLVAFGSFAGRAGMVNCFRGLGERLLGLGYSTPFLNVGSAYMYPDLDKAKRAVKRLGESIKIDGLPPQLAPLVFVFTGTGNVSKGAREVFELLPHNDFFIVRSKTKNKRHDRKLDSRFRETKIEIFFYLARMVDPSVLPLLFGAADGKGCAAGGSVESCTKRAKYIEGLEDCDFSREVIGTVVKAEHMVFPSPAMREITRTWRVNTQSTLVELKSGLSRSSSSGDFKNKSVEFDRERYQRSPGDFDPTFHRDIAPYASVIVTGHYWDPRFPRLLTSEQLRALREASSDENALYLSPQSSCTTDESSDSALTPKRPLLVADLTCDIGGSMEFLTHTTEPHAPFYLVKPTEEGVRHLLSMMLLILMTMSTMMKMMMFAVREGVYDQVKLWAMGVEPSLEGGGQKLMVSTRYQYNWQEEPPIIDRESSSGMYMDTWPRLTIRVCAVQNASEFFGNALLPLIEPLLETELPEDWESPHLIPELKGAEIVRKGRLTERFRYIAEIRREAERVAARAAASSENKASSSFSSSSSLVVHLDGHLFDTGLMNQALNLLESMGASFDILDVDVRPNWASVRSEGHEARTTNVGHAAHSSTPMLAQQQQRNRSSAVVEIQLLDFTDDRGGTGYSKDATAAAAEAESILAALTKLVEAIPGAEATLTVVPGAKPRGSTSARSGGGGGSLLHLEEEEEGKEAAEESQRLETLPPPVDAISDSKRVLVLGSGMVVVPALKRLTDKGYDVVVGGADLKQVEAALERVPGFRLFGEEGNGAKGSMKHRKGTLEAVELAVPLPGSGGRTADIQRLRREISRADVVVSLVPPPFHPEIASIALEHDTPVVTASYVSDEMRRRVGKQAEEKRIPILCEMGLDPGLDHMCIAKFIDEGINNGAPPLHTFESVCGGIPSLEAVDNPLKYKFSWSPKGVLTAASASCKYRSNGEVRSHSPPTTYESVLKSAHFPGLDLEVSPNRDSLAYESVYDGIRSGGGVVPNFMRGTLRHRGWAEAMHAAFRLGLLSDKKIDKKVSTWSEVFCNSKPRPIFLSITVCDKFILQYLLMKVVKAVGADEDLLDVYAKEDAGVAGEMVRWALVESEDITRLLPTPTGASAEWSPVDLFANALWEKSQYRLGEQDLALMSNTLQFGRADETGGYMARGSLHVKGDGSPEGSAMARTVGFTAAAGAEIILEGGLNSLDTGGGIIRPTIPQVYEPALKILEECGDVEFEDALEDQCWNGRNLDSISKLRELANAKPSGIRVESQPENLQLSQMQNPVHLLKSTEENLCRSLFALLRGIGSIRLSPSAMRATRMMSCPSARRWALKLQKYPTRFGGPGTAAVPSCSPPRCWFGVIRDGWEEHMPEYSITRKQRKIRERTEEQNRMRTRSAKNINKALKATDEFVGMEILRSPRLSFASIDKIFVTHMHGDHVFGLPGLLASVTNAKKESRQAGKEQPPIDIYGPQGLGEYLNVMGMTNTFETKPRFNLHELKDPDYVGGKRLHHQIKTSGPGAGVFDVCEDDKCVVKAVMLPHAPNMKSIAYVVQEKSIVGRVDVKALSARGVLPGPIYKRIKNGEKITLPNGDVINGADFLGPRKPGRKIAIVMDNKNSEGVVDLAYGADVMIHESSFEAGLRKVAEKKGHCTSKMAGETAREAGVKQLVLTHFSNRYALLNSVPGLPGVDLLVDEAMEAFRSDNPCVLFFITLQVVAAIDFMSIPITRASSD